jgi:hypothetical protein
MLGANTRRKGLYNSVLQEIARLAGDLCDKVSICLLDLTMMSQRKLQGP